MRITTRDGDLGNTSLFSGDIVRKDHIVLEALGACDELTCRLGLAKLHMDRFKATVTRIQKALIKVAGYISSLGNVKCNEMEKELHLLDVLVEEYGRDIGEEFESFIIPGENIPSAEFHLARVVCRKLERRFVALESIFRINPLILKYINRLADVLYLMAVIAEKEVKPVEDEF